MKWKLARGNWVSVVVRLLMFVFLAESPHMVPFPVSEFHLTLASDFSGVFDLFRYVLLTPFLGIGLATGVFIGGRISAGRGRVVGPLALIDCVIVTAFISPSVS